MAVQTSRPGSPYTTSELAHKKLALGYPHADKRFDRVWLATNGVWHQGGGAAGDQRILLHYTVYRGFALSTGSASGTIEGVTEQWDSNQSWVFYLDRNCWGRLIDLEFEFPAPMMREDSLIRPPIAIDFEVLREL